jgi:hypothetical protein
LNFVIHGDISVLQVFSSHQILTTLQNFPIVIATEEDRSYGIDHRAALAQRDEIIRKQTDEIDRLRARLASLSGSNQAPS